FGHGDSSFGVLNLESGILDLPFRTPKPGPVKLGKQLAVIFRPPKSTYLLHFHTLLRKSHEIYNKSFVFYNSPGAIEVASFLAFVFNNIPASNAERIFFCAL